MHQRIEINESHEEVEAWYGLAAHRGRQKEDRQAEQLVQAHALARHRINNAVQLRGHTKHEEASRTTHMQECTQYGETIGMEVSNGGTMKTHRTEEVE
jgi:hypothetical protein